MADPFTIRIFVPDGDPDGLKIVEKMNWTGRGIVFQRDRWAAASKRPEFENPGVYILVGYAAEDDVLRTVYIGQADGLRSRITSHSKDPNKEFWDWGIAFVSSAGGLNRAHITWLEYALVKRARELGQCSLANGNSPSEPALSEPEKADTRVFFKELLQVVPLVGLKAFEKPKTIKVTPSGDPNPSDFDTLVIPARKEGFEQVFLGEHCWYAVRIAASKRDKIRYLAAYQSAPDSAITYYAPVKEIVPYGDNGKFKLVFSEPATKIGPIPFADAPQGYMQGSRYTTLAKLKKANKVTDIV